MSDLDVKAVCACVGNIQTSLINKQRMESSEITRFSEILDIMAEILKKKNMAIWKVSDTHKVYEEMKLPPAPSKLTVAYKRRMLKINQVLCKLLHLIKCNSALKVVRMPELNYFPRSSLAISQDEYAFSLLDEFHLILKYYISHKPNFHTPSKTMCPDLMIIMIAFDGMVINGIDSRLSHLQNKHVHLSTRARIDTLTGLRSNYRSVMKSNSIGQLSSLYLKILMPRARLSQERSYVFPARWRVGSKKSKRQADINHRLSEIWDIVHPGRSVPSNWGVRLWTRLARMSLSTLGTPYVVHAALTGKISAAQLDHSGLDLECGAEQEGSANIVRDLCVDKKVSYDVYDEVLAELFFLRVRVLLLQYPKKEKGMKTKRLAAEEVERLKNESSALFKGSKNSVLLAGWVIWLLRSQAYRKTTFSTILTYVSLLPCRLLPLLGEQQIELMSGDDWTDLISCVASDVGYASSSKRQTKTHLRSLYQFLKETESQVPYVNWDSYSFKVSKDIPCAKVVNASEIDAILNTLPTDDSLWAALVLAFYGGLRCEEITGIRSVDYVDQYRLHICWSKRQSSRRSVPIGWLVPEPYSSILQDIMNAHKQSGKDVIVSDQDGKAMSSNTLGKKMARLLQGEGVSVASIHAQRHAFASWCLVRYFMLVDPDFHQAVLRGEVCGEVSSDVLFSVASLRDYARVIGGARWERDWDEYQVCLGKPSDIAQISILLGHTNRYTAIENYFNSMEWIISYYLEQRCVKLAALRL